MRKDEAREARDQQESLADAFWAVGRRLRHGSRDTLAPSGLSPSQWRALRTLARSGPVRLSDLAARLQIAPRSVTEVVDELAARGLVARSPDPSDRRATLVATTEAGWGLLKQLRRMRRDEADQVFASLSAEDRRELARILRILSE